MNDGRVIELIRKRQFKRVHDKNSSLNGYMTTCHRIEERKVQLGLHSSKHWIGLIGRDLNDNDCTMRCRMQKTLTTAGLTILWTLLSVVSDQWSNKDLILNLKILMNTNNFNKFSKLL